MRHRESSKFREVCEYSVLTDLSPLFFHSKDSDEITYRGPLDSDHLAKAVLL